MFKKPWEEGGKVLADILDEDGLEEVAVVMEKESSDVENQKICPLH